jgi:hypothetical protein
MAYMYLSPPLDIFLLHEYEFDVIIKVLSTMKGGNKMSQINSFAATYYPVCYPVCNPISARFYNICIIIK